MLGFRILDIGISSLELRGLLGSGSYNQAGKKLEFVGFGVSGFRDWGFLSPEPYTQNPTPSTRNPKL